MSLLHRLLPKTLVVDGNAGDTLDLSESIVVGDFWGTAGTATNWTKKYGGTVTQDFGGGSHTYQIYYVNQNMPGQVTLFVDTSVVVS